MWRDRGWHRLAIALPVDAGAGPVQAHLCAVMTYRTAADVLEQMFPVDMGKHHETLRRHTLKVGEALSSTLAIFQI